MGKDDLGFTIAIGGLAIMGLIYLGTDGKFFDDSPSLKDEIKETVEENEKEGVFGQNKRQDQKKTDEKNESENSLKTDVYISKLRTTKHLGERDEDELFDKKGYRDEELEYIEIEASRKNSKPIVVTSWKLRSVRTGNEVVIPQARMVINGDHRLVPILLNPGAELIIFSGQTSNRWFSYRLNICSGYLNDQLLERDIRKNVNEKCPDPEDWPLPDYVTEDLICMDEIKDVRKCELHGSIPNIVPRKCGQYIRDNFNYNGCVDTFEKQPEFNLDEWRVYLDLDDPVWDEDDDIIELVDPSGEVADTYID